MTLSPDSTTRPALRASVSPVGGIARCKPVIIAGLLMFVLSALRLEPHGLAPLEGLLA